MTMQSLPKLLPYTFAAVFLFAISPVFAQEASLDDIVEAHVKAIGGKEAIAKVSNFNRKATVTLEGGLFGTMKGKARELVDVKGNRFYNNLDLVQYKKTEAMTGDTGWTKGTDGDREMNAEELGFAKMSLGVSPFLSAYESFKDGLKVKGTEKFNDKECHVISAGPEIAYLVNTKTSLLEAMKLPAVGALIFGDYEETKGVQFPGKRTLKIEAQGISIEYKFESTTVNTKFEPSIFYEDGEVPEEQKPQTYTVKQVMAFLDKNDDEKINKDEANADLKAAFGQVDTNGDGFIDMNETKMMVEYMNKENYGQPKKPAKPSADDVTGSQIIASMDKNDDGRISKDEANEELKVFFAERDTNGDGLIDVKEAKPIAEYVNSNK